MKLDEAVKKILDSAEKTLDQMTGETPESRAEAKEKMKSFFESLVGSKDDEKDTTKEANNEND